MIDAICVGLAAAHSVVVFSDRDDADVEEVSSALREQEVELPRVARHSEHAHLVVEREERVHVAQRGGVLQREPAASAHLNVAC